MPLSAPRDSVTKTSKAKRDQRKRQRARLRADVAKRDKVITALRIDRDRLREALASWMPHDHSAQTSPERPINGCERCRWKAEGWL